MQTVRKAKGRISASLPENMKRTMRQWASGVTVVTTKYGTMRSGMTVSAFVSGTIDPPTVMVCLNSSSATLKMIRRSKRLAISVLGEKQQAASNIFAGADPSIRGDGRFNKVKTFASKTGSPILSGSIGWLDCLVSRMVKLSTHHLVVCSVVAAGQSRRPAGPLLYFDRGYRNMRG